MYEPVRDFNGRPAGAAPFIFSQAQHADDTIVESALASQQMSEADSEAAATTLPFQPAESGDQSTSERQLAIWPLAFIGLGLLLTLLWAALVGYAAYELIDWIR